MSLPNWNFHFGTQAVARVYSKLPLLKPLFSSSSFASDSSSPRRSRSCLISRTEGKDRPRKAKARRSGSRTARTRKAAPSGR